jgi:Arc/MetJ-type ribon-helix-helix transcriptional regulator
MISSIQVNIRTTEFLVNELDRIVKDGYFRSRSEALNEGIRLIIRRYKLAKLESKLLEAKQGSKDLPSVTDALIRAREEEDG